MVKLSRSGWRIAAASTSLLVSLALAPTAPALAAKSHPPKSPQVVATGLNNPRHLTWANGALYVVEAGKGGSGPCIAGPEGKTCYGASGSITKLKHHRQYRVVKGLPSLADEGTGENAIGPSDVLINGRHFTVAIGLGTDPNFRPTSPGKAKKLATVSTGKFGREGLNVVADIARFENRVNPAGDEKDTNPVALLRRHGGKAYLVDAGGNSLLKLGRKGKVRTTAIFPNTDVPLGGGTFSMDAVPTAAAYGPDGAIYVSQLTGFPFPKGGASIWRIVPGHNPAKYATGLTNVTDLAFAKDGSLYAVQITDEGLAAPVKPNPGSVVRIPAGGGATHKTVIANLTAPYGIVLRHGSAYVTTCAVCPGGGEVLQVPLDR